MSSYTQTGTYSRHLVHFRSAQLKHKTDIQVYQNIQSMPPPPLPPTRQLSPPHPYRTLPNAKTEHIIHARSKRTARHAPANPPSQTPR